MLGAEACRQPKGMLTLLGRSLRQETLNYAMPSRISVGFIPDHRWVFQRKETKISSKLPQRFGE